jgi:hypothetical protein
MVGTEDSVEVVLQDLDPRRGRTFALGPVVR